MGIIEVIGTAATTASDERRGKRYSACTDASGRLRSDVDPTTAHRNHIHFSLSRAGAQMQTSYWRYVWLQEPLPKLAEPIGGGVPEGEGRRRHGGGPRPPGQDGRRTSRVGSARPPADDAAAADDAPGRRRWRRRTSGPRRRRRTL